MILMEIMNDQASGRPLYGPFQSWRIDLQGFADYHRISQSTGARYTAPMSLQAAITVAKEHISDLFAANAPRGIRLETPL
jgi:hypothetical protein